MRSLFGCARGDVDFENLSNSLFHEWNNFEHNAITDDTKATNLSSQPSSHRNRTELEIIFTRVGLQSSVACKLADEVYAKLDLSADQSIAFNDFLSLMQSDLDVLRQQQQSAPIPSESIASIKYSDDEYSNNPINDGMIIDLHSHSGLCSLHIYLLLSGFFCSFLFSFSLNVTPMRAILNHSCVYPLFMSNNPKSTYLCALHLSS